MGGEICGEICVDGDGNEIVIEPGIVELCLDGATDLVIETVDTVLQIDQEDDVIELIDAGMPGPRGIPGPPGTNGDKNYLHTQALPAATWIVVHNLVKYPAVTVVDSGGALVIGDVHYDSVNQCTLNFAGAFSGVATFN